MKRTVVFIVVLSLLLLVAPGRMSGQAQKGKAGKQSHSQTVNPRDPLLNFEHVWKTLDRNYGQFLIKHVDWDALYRVYRPQVTPATTDKELWDILLAMMGHLNDAHLCLADGSRRVGGSRNEGFINEAFSLDLVKSKYLQNKFSDALGGSFSSGWLAEGVGYLYIGDLKDGLEPITKTIDAVMAEFAKAKVMIVDVRNNPGGTGRAVEIVAGRFADRWRHYSTNRTRYGPKHDDFWLEEYSTIEPGGPLQFTGPTVLLTDRASASAAEGFVLAMRVLPHVTVVGDTTEGAFSSQFPDKMPNGWTLWVAFKELRDHDGVCWDGVGIPAAENKLKELLKHRQDGPVFDEADFNVLGYKLLQENKLDSAIFVFEKNVRLYPDSWNAWDSLGEIAAKAGRKEQAIASYRKSLELNPKNKNGQAMLKRLEEGQ